MSKYYLIAKSKKDNRFEIVKIRGNEIYCNGSNDLERSFSLEKIDLFTSIFHNETQLINYLRKNGRISLDDCELFVASRNGNTIKYLNCMYHFSDRVDLLREIMLSSDNNRLSKDSLNVNKLLDDFIHNMYTRDNFYKLVVYGYTDIYKKFVNYLKGRNVTLKEYSFAKYRDGKWAMSSYNLYRSIMDAYNLYNQIYKSRDMFSEASKIRDKNKSIRDSITSELIIYTDKDYVDGQISMFDTNYVSNERTEPQSVEPLKVEVSTTTVSRDDKLTEVLTFLNSFPRGMFIGEKLDFNPNIFPGCDVSCLNNISIRLKRLINSYTVSKYHYDRALEYQGNTRELALDLKADRKDILKLLEKDTILDKFYNFCILYDKIKEEYESKVKEGKVYGKRKDNQ